MVTRHLLIVGKGHTLLCIRLGCFMLVFPFLFLSLHKILFNECVLLQLLLLLLLLLKSSKCLSTIGRFLPLL